MVDVAVIALSVSLVAAALSLICLVGLVWTMSELKGFQKSKYSVMYPNYDLPEPATESLQTPAMNNGEQDNMDFMWDETI